ncbi:MAG TPA: hypothetical protein VFZ00_09030, partial [Solirubrobacter sp.]|nr:hypothetical protein [Solirubrobacter sp.]
MRRDELIELASPPCSECGEPIRRVEIPWQLNGDGDWVPGSAVMVCGNGHRVPVAPLELLGDVPESVEVADAR